jgi:hypothetical protein
MLFIGEEIKIQNNHDKGYMRPLQRKDISNEPKVEVKPPTRSSKEIIEHLYYNETKKQKQIEVRSNSSNNSRSRRNLMKQN